MGVVISSEGVKEGDLRPLNYGMVIEPNTSYKSIAVVLMMSSAGIVGLILGLIGSGLVIIPTFRVFKNMIVSREKIESLEKGRRELLRGGKITRDQDSFEPVAAVIEREWDNTIENDRRAIYSVPLGAFGGGGFVCLVGSDGDIPGGDDSKKPGSILIVDTWIRDEIDRLKTTPVQRVRGLGFALIVVSVFVQSIHAI